MAKWHFRRWLRGRDPDSPQRLLPAPDSGPNWHLCTGRLEQGHVRGLHKDHGAQRRDPGHDPSRSGVPGVLIQPPRLQRVRFESLTGSLRHPRPALAWTPRPLDPSIVTQPLLHQPSSHDPPLLPPAPGQIQCDVWECCHPFEGLTHKIVPFLGKLARASLTVLNGKGLLRVSVSSGPQKCSNNGETELLLRDSLDWVTQTHLLIIALCWCFMS